MPTQDIRYITIQFVVFDCSKQQNFAFMFPSKDKLTLYNLHKHWSALLKNIKKPYAVTVNTREKIMF